jgi:tetratricopeptide (TPR) repeat protein/TolB-like protein/tRNA A-37 threonylcarbamoyl transferase component Bud32
MVDSGTKPKPAPISAALSGTIEGRFVIRNLLGAGGMGEVYRAEDTRLKRLVALKRIAPAIRNNESNRRRLWQEAECVSRLNDPHIAAVFDIFESGDDIFLVMEYVEGQTLRRRLEQPLSVAEFLDIAEQCASALAAAHKGGVQHRDIKPENLMLTAAGELKVLDFGLARTLLREDGTTLESAGSAKFEGTFAYMSPEALQEKSTDERADIFSLGVVFYEALGRRHPFRVRGAGFLETYERILHEEPAPLRQLNPEVPAELERMVAKMLAKNPGDRYASAADLATDLRALRRSLAPAVVTRAPARPKWIARTVVGAPVALVVVVLAVVAAVPSVREHVESWLRIGSVPKQKQLAVLEFQAVDGSPEDASFTAGLTDTVTTKLTQLTGDRSLQVVPARDLRERHVATAEQARRDFGVNLVLEGSLHKSGDQVRVNYALVDARTRRQLSARSVTLAASDPFAVQDQIVNGAVDMLQLQIPSAEGDALRPHGTQVPGAYMLYLQGKGYLEDYDKPDNIDTAVNLFQQALQLDPTYALAYASLGDAYWKKYLHTKDVRLIEGTRAPCDQALHLDEKLSAAHECLGTIAAGTGHYEEAVKEFERALDSEPTNNDAYTGLAHAYELLGKPAEAEKTYRRAIDLRSQYWGGYNSLGTFYFRQMQYPRAAEMFSKVVALVPDSFHGYDNLGAAYLGQGEYPEAIDTFKHSISLRPTAYAYSNIGTAYFYMRRFDDAATNYEQSLKLDENDFEVWWSLGEADSWSPGKKSQAEHAYRQCISLGNPQLQVDPRDVDAMAILAICHAMLNQRKPATELLQKAFALGPTDAELSFKAAIVYTQLHDEGQAVQRLGEALVAGYPAKLARDTPIFDQYRSNPRVQEMFRSR